MEQRRLADSSIEVSRLILGGGCFGGVGSMLDLIGHGESEEEALAIMDRAWELGITTFDTADAYAGGASERAIGRWIRTRGVRPTLITKVFHPMAVGEDSGLAPARIRRQLESSLERLGVEQIDVYLTHARDPSTPLGSTLDALDELQANGTIGLHGSSNCDERLLRRTGGRSRVVQNSYSLLDRSDATSVLPLVEAGSLGYLPFSPLAGGWLAGRYARNAPPPAGSRRASLPSSIAHLDRDDVWRGLELLRARASAFGVALPTLAYAWALSDPRVTAVLIGPRNAEQLRPAVAALELPLSAADRRELELFFVPEDQQT